MSLLNLQTGHYLTLWISSPDTYSERRLGSDLTISDLKYKLEPVTGIPFNHQIIRLQRTVAAAGHGGAGEGPGEKEIIALMDDERRTLESYGVKDWMTLRVDSTDPKAKATAGQFTDTANLERFELTMEEYENRTDTVRAYKLRNKLGRFATPSPSPSTNSGTLTYVPPPEDLIPGARCEVSFSEELSRRGTVKFVGATEFGKDESIWVGVEWDEPVGKGDGMVEGKRYFKTLPLRASFVRPDKVTVGDFPEIDPFASDEEMEM